jgi:hypothetical protein
MYFKCPHSSRVVFILEAFMSSQRHLHRITPQLQKIGLGCGIKNYMSYTSILHFLE